MAIASIAPVAAETVKTAAGGSIATGVWSLVGVVVTSLTVLAVAIVKQWGPWKKAASDDRAADFDRLRQEIVDIRAQARSQSDELHEELKAVRAEAKSAREAVNRLEAMLACVRPAVSILVAEVRRLDPGNEANAAVVQAQDLMAAASVGDFGIDRAFIGLANIQATKK